jgi:hypothetical protein
MVENGAAQCLNRISPAGGLCQNPSYIVLNNMPQHQAFEAAKYS